MSALRRARSEDLVAIAKIHGAAFPRSALTRLGVETVRRYYAWLLAGPHDAVFLVHETAGAIEGFVVGGRFARAFGGFVLRNKLHLATRVLRHPQLVLSRLGRRRVTSLLATFRRPTGPAPAPLYRCLSIAVHPAAEGHGVGQALLDGLTEAARASGATRMQLGVDPSNLRAVRFYERLGWTRMTRATTWFGDAAPGAWSGLMERHLDAPD